MTLTEIAEDIKTHIEEADAWAHQVLAEHVPAIAEAAEKAENDPLVQAALSVVLPASVRLMLADMVARLASEFPPPPAPEAEPEPQAAESAEPDAVPA
jgi:hypothetical protein